MKLYTHPLFDDPGQPWGPPITEALLAKVHHTLGCQLPPRLIEALRSCNGGRLRRTELRIDGRARPIHIRDLAGIGYPEGLEASLSLAREWDYPEPCLVLSAEGPTALLLDYRHGGEPSVVFVNTDEEVDGRPAEWPVARSFHELTTQLTHVASRTQVAVLGIPHADVLLDAASQLGAMPPTRPDHEGAFTRALHGWRCAEPGPSLLRLLPSRRPDGSQRLAELVAPTTPLWVAETNVSDVARFIATFAATMPGDHIRLTV